MGNDSFLSQPVTPTITCPSCGETLLYGDKQCRFCHTVISDDYASESVVSRAHLTQAAKSANVIRAFRNLIYIVLGLAILGLFTKDPSLVTTALIISVLNIVAPIRWLKKYGGMTLADADVIRAQQQMKVELYLWVGAILAEGIAWSILWAKR